MKFPLTPKYFWLPCFILLFNLFICQAQEYPPDIQKLEDISGQFTTHEQSFASVVTKPFYFQNWFILLCILSVLSLDIGFIAYKAYKTSKVQLQLEHTIKELTDTIVAQTEVINQQAAQLKQLDELKSRFIASISQDLKNPLSIILGSVKSMINSESLNNKNLVLAKLTRQSARQILEFINKILDLSRLDSNQIKVENHIINIYQTIRSIIAHLELVAQSQNIQFEFYSEVDRYLMIRLDAKKFEKILNNILSNAFKFTSNGGKVIVEIKDLGNKIQLKVQDTGPGIHPEDLPFIFNRFYQSTQPNAPLAGGAGLGLALSMELANLMESKLWVESILGSGSSFYLEFTKKEVLHTDLSSLKSLNKQEHIYHINHPDTLGISKVDQQTLSNIPAPNREAVLSPSQNQKPRILIVEDNPSLRTYLETILKGSYEISLAKNGRAALERLNHKVNSNDNSHNHLLPDLILTDMMMPEMDGYQLLNELKNHSKYRLIPVIALTAKAELEDRVQALRIGVDDYILKPFDEEQLLLRISNVLQNLQERKLVWENNHKINSTTKDTSSRSNGMSKQIEIPTSEEGVSKEDLEWLSHTEDMIKKHLGKFDFSVEELAELLATNRWQLNNRIKTCTGLTARQYILEVRINHARYLLETKKTKSVKHTVYEVGMRDIKYFSKQFKKRFGKTPSNYL